MNNFVSYSQKADFRWFMKKLKLKEQRQLFVNKLFFEKVDPKGATKPKNIFTYGYR